MKYCNGAMPVSLSVSPPHAMFLHPLSLCQSTLCPWKVQRVPAKLKFPRSTGRSRVDSPNNWQPNFPITGHGNPPCLHPCAYFSRKLSPAQQNYGIGNRELLAIKLSLEEWRHWLEGAKFAFTVITDHRNLECLRDAKRLISRQARWALFLTRFHFTVT